jgi:hypothetical protein
MSNEIFVPENYIKKEGKFNAIQANIFPFIVLICALIIFGFPFYFLWPDRIPNFRANMEIPYLERLLSTILLLIIIILGIIVHELIHALFFMKFLKNGFKSIKFTFKGGMINCHFIGIIKINEYYIGLLMPLIIIGIMPAIISLIIGNIFLLFFGILLTCASGVDILIFYLLFIKLKLRGNSWFQNHPSNPYSGIIYKPKEQENN